MARNSPCRDNRPRGAGPELAMLIGSAKPHVHDEQTAREAFDVPKAEW
jgi:hypothetical protein